MQGRHQTWNKTLATALTVGCAVFCALVVVEGGLRLVNSNALFAPAIFDADLNLGVKLRPNAKVRLRRRGGNVSVLSTNAAGRRPTGSLAAPTAPRVVIVGDSQTLGYHVNDDETFAHRLAQRFGKTARIELHAVPTYGPQEYRRVLLRAAAREDVAAAIVVVTMGNDWMERATSNAARTTARFGFAAGKTHREAVTWTARIAKAIEPLTPYAHLAVYAQRGRASGDAPALGPSSLLAFAAHHDPQFEATRMLDVLDPASLPMPLLVASLPLDVEIDASHRAKYAQGNRAPLDSSAHLPRYHDALLAQAASRGGRAVDIRPALRELGAPAFLSDDDHLSSLGHAAIADALEKPLRTVLSLSSAPQKLAGITPRGTP